MIKTKTFRFIGSKNNYIRGKDTNKKIYTKEIEIDNTINKFISENQYTIVDIKISTIDTHYHNNCGYNEVDLLYTILYDDKNIN